MSKLSWIFFGFLAIGVGCYPAMYLLMDMQGGLLSSKSEALLNGFWLDAFYLHIIPGGVALLIGWLQFSDRLRKKRLAMHRMVGKLYMSMVAISGLAGLYLSYEANGGIVAKIGFACLAIAWLSTSFMGWKTVQEGNIVQHQRWMIRSYAMCFAAVTLRLWLPIFMIIGIPFMTGYIIISWLCWVPNLIFAELVISRQKRKSALTAT